MATTVIDDRQTTRDRPGFLSQIVERRDKRSRWTLSRQGKRDGARNIPNVAALDAHNDAVLSDDQLRSIGAISRIHSNGAARVHELGMEWRSDEARLVSTAIELASQRSALHARIAELQRQQSNFETNHPKDDSRPAVGTAPRALSTPSDFFDDAGGYDVSAARSARAAAENARREKERAARRVAIDDSLVQAIESLSQIPLQIHAIRQELIQDHELCVNDAARHRTFAYELMSVYWAQNQATRRTWWRRFLSKIRKKPLATLPQFRVLTIDPETWETSDPTSGLKGLFDQLSLLTATGDGSIPEQSLMTEATA